MEKYILFYSNNAAYYFYRYSRYIEDAADGIRNRISVPDAHCTSVVSHNVVLLSHICVSNSGGIE
jgi:hypothetical protein